MYEYRHAIYSNISTSVSLLPVRIRNRNQPFSCGWLGDFIQVNEDLQVL